MSNIVKRAIFPVAGLGTRFLPATKALPKEMLPVLDTPIIQYAVDEARAAGIEEFIFVTAKGKDAIENHFDRSTALENKLEKAGKLDAVEILKHINIPSGDMMFTRQHDALGLGHAVWCARKFIQNEPFAVMLPDDMVLAEKPVMQQMCEAYQDTGGAMIAVTEVPNEMTQKYGVIDPVGDASGTTVEMKGMVEKPAPADAPSNLAVIGRYILPANVMDILGGIGEGSGGEIQLTDGIAKLIGQMPVKGFRYEGTRYDCGTMVGFLQANIGYALSRPDLAGRIEEHMAELLRDRGVKF